MQSIIDMMQERGDNNVQIAFNMFTIAHLKAMAFVLAGKNGYVSNYNYGYL